ncbi:F-box only protein 42 [Aplysia californica]|uniref:F-box only protein 42 n=1 Tax=Aplysia californica TaxID=6500 RepID=A0ABM0K3A3_APLCA|nr:F-box only protein 42 [Aplysia californica]
MENNDTVCRSGPSPSQMRESSSYDSPQEDLYQMPDPISSTSQSALAGVSDCDGDGDGDLQVDSMLSHDVSTDLEEDDVQAMNTSLSFEGVPEEVLEHILSYLSPYKDMDSAKLVSKRWLRVIKSVVKHRRRHFYQNLSNCDVEWTEVVKDVQSGFSERNHCSHITDRFSHSAAYWNGAMYVFGGCTSTNTTFNDLWIFDLTSRQWIRPVAMGSYPSPKACATMVVYNGNLVLYGGWSHPIPYPLHQSAHYFSELHVYSPVSNRWSHVLSLGVEPEALGGHSASVAGHLMIIFGGSPRPGQGTNNLWVFNFLKGSWKLQPVTRDAKPEPRYGQFQTTLDVNHVLIMGGCVGPNRPYNDVWLLTLHQDDPWQWTKIAVLKPELAAPQTWCHGACRVRDTIVVVAKSSKPRQAKNRKAWHPRPSPQEQEEGKWAGAATASACVQTSPQQPPAGAAEGSGPHSQEASRPSTSGLSSLQAGAMEPEEGVASEMCPPQQQHKGNLLALQQRLHRECASLQDPDNHHHNPHRLAQPEPEGHFLRLENRWVHGGAAPPPPQHQRLLGEHQPALQQQQQQQQQPRQQQQPQQQQPRQQPPQRPAQPVLPPNRLALQQSPGHNPLANIQARGRGNGMPSIRPNAMCNRQKQLEALQRQEEILRSKSRALAAAKKQAANGGGVSREDSVPEIIQTKNKMDVHILDIGEVISKGVAEWRPLSKLQATCAPTETICCSLLEGRGELILFGGVVREATSPVVINTAISKLYLLHA